MVGAVGWSEVVLLLQIVFAALGSIAALVAVGLAVREAQAGRDERARALEHEQVRRLLEGLERLGAVLRDNRVGHDFDLARAHVAAALALRPVVLPACEAVIADDMPGPPYAMGAHIAYGRLEAAQAEVREHSRELGRRPADG